MPIWEWILIAAIAVVVVVSAVVAVSMIGFRTKTKRLKQHYGTEYERVVDETGSEKGAVRELTTRERKRDKLDIVALTPSALSEFTARWQEVQAGFVDNPATAVGVADRLVTEVMSQRGYPVDDFDQRAADISVDHPQIVDDYRAAHGIHLSEQHAEHRTTTGGVCALSRFVREIARDPNRQRSITGGKRMTTHEQHTVDDARDEVAAPVTDEPRVADEGTIDAREPAPAADDVSVTPPEHEASTGETLFASDDVVDLRARWVGVQAAFVDNPKECVQQADHLVSDVVEQLTTGFAQTRSRLEGQWSEGQEASTEDLRVALMHYREFFDRLLAV